MSKIENDKGEDPLPGELLGNHRRRNSLFGAACSFSFHSLFTYTLAGWTYFCSFCYVDASNLSVLRHSARWEKGVVRGAVPTLFYMSESMFIGSRKLDSGIFPISSLGCMMASCITLSTSIREDVCFYDLKDEELWSRIVAFAIPRTRMGRSSGTTYRSKCRVANQV